MSQQMNFEENRRDDGPSYSAGYAEMPHYDSSAGWASGQKLSAVDFDRGPSSNQRLALAIVSIVFLMIMSIIMLAIAFIANSRASVVPIFVLLLFYFSVIFINVLFNRRH